MKKNTKIDLGIPTLFRTKEMSQMLYCTEVPEKNPPKRKTCEAASSSEPAALPFGHVSEINGMHSNSVQFQEDAAALMQEENKQRGACLTAPCV